MFNHYEPSSEFLKAVLADEAPLCGSEMGERNFDRLVEMTRDRDRLNRDWATMLLSQVEVDTSKVRVALIKAAQDEDAYVRGSALLGLAQRDRALALPMVRDALLEDAVYFSVFEAAAIIAHACLAEPLRMWINPLEDEWVDRAAREALLACEAGVDIK